MGDGGKRREGTRKVSRERDENKWNAMPASRDRMEIEASRSLYRQRLRRAPSKEKRATRAVRKGGGEKALCRGNGSARTGKKT